MPLSAARIALTVTWRSPSARGDIALRRVAVDDLSISEAKRDAPSFEERACLRRAEHRIDSRTGLMIIEEVGNHVDDELVLVGAGRGAPGHRPEDAAL
jgi:hypothetical protein